MIKHCVYVCVYVCQFLILCWWTTVCVYVDVFRWPRWKSLNTHKVPRTACMPSTILRPAPPWLETTSGDTCRWTQLPFTCWCWQRWRPLVLWHVTVVLLQNHAEHGLLSECVTVSHRPAYRLKPGRGRLYPEHGVLHRSCLQSGCEYSFFFFSLTVGYVSTKGNKYFCIKHKVLKVTLLSH